MIETILTWGSILLCALVVLSWLVGHRIPRRDGTPVEYKILRQYQDERCRPVIVVQASSSRDASRAVEGWTYPGNVSWEQTRIGHNEYMLRVVDWDTKLR